MEIPEDSAVATGLAPKGLAGLSFFRQGSGLRIVAEEGWTLEVSDLSGRILSRSVGTGSQRVVLPSGDAVLLCRLHGASGRESTRLLAP
jgi:hypothetical protein